MKVLFNEGRTTVSTGRNGDFICTGTSLTVWDWSNTNGDKLVIQGYTSRGEIARGDLTVPMHDVPELIQALQDMLANYRYSQEIKSLV